MVTLCRELNKTTFVMFTVNINFNLMGSLSFFLFLFLPFAWCLSLITLVQIWLMWALQIEIGLIMKIMFNTITSLSTSCCLQYIQVDLFITRIELNKSKWPFKNLERKMPSASHSYNNFLLKSTRFISQLKFKKIFGKIN